MLDQYLPLILFPLIALAPVLLMLKRIRDTREKQTSFPLAKGDLVPRPAGWSLRERTEELSDLLGQWFMALIIVPAFLGYACVVSKQGFWFFLVIVILFTLFVARKIKPLVQMLANYKLGLKGEEIVGTELSRMWSREMAVFHDLEVNPANGKPWNIDHVVVAPSGVFAIETKMRRKKKGTSEENQVAHIVRYDGVDLHFPHGTDRHGIDQARRNAKWLSAELSRVTAETVECTPILTLPGWFVKSVGQGDVKVISHKGIENFITNEPTVLDHNQQVRIREWLNDRCVVDL